MKEIFLYAKDERGLSDAEISAALDEFLAQCDKRDRALLLPPDFTRMHSGAGKIANMLYHKLEGADVDVMPALGTHVPVSEEEKTRFFGDIPSDRYLIHNWKTEVESLGEVPADFVREVSEGILDEPFEVEVNRALIHGGYDMILSIGQVVPHEVVGMANYTKNLLVGVGGSRFINKSHLLGAMYGMERIMGRDHSPVRKVFDYAEQNYLSRLPLYYILTVTTNTPEGIAIHGLFIGSSRKPFEAAVKLSQQKNLIFMDKPFRKVVVYLDPDEFKSTWLGNKAVYRTRMAIADGGELIVLAPGVKMFGEDAENDRLIRKFGYTGREHILDLFRKEEELQKNQSVAAHLVHGSSDGRFSITYCTTHLSREEIEGVGFAWEDYAEAAKRYDPKKLHNGYNTLPDGEEVFFIENPALGLWADKSKFE